MCFSDRRFVRVCGWVCVCACERVRVRIYMAGRMRVDSCRKHKHAARTRARVRHPPPIRTRTDALAHTRTHRNVIIADCSPAHGAYAIPCTVGINMQFYRPPECTHTHTDTAVCKSIQRPIGRCIVSVSVSTPHTHTHKLLGACNSFLRRWAQPFCARFVALFGAHPL